MKRSEDEIPDIEFVLSLTTESSQTIDFDCLTKIEFLRSARHSNGNLGKLTPKKNTKGGYSVGIYESSDGSELVEALSELVKFIGKNDDVNWQIFNLTIGVFSANSFCVPLIFKSSDIEKICKAKMSLQIYYYPD